MMNDYKWIDAPARLLMSLLFLISGIGKIAAVASTQTYMEAFGISGLLLWPAAAWEIAGGVCLLVGFKTRPVALLLAGWCLLTASIFHTAFADQTQMVMFLKNLTMAGGFLLVGRFGMTTFSVDAYLAAQERSAS